jgi:hypothetical protein
MPFICIGPVCIPWTAVVPILIWLGKPIWVRLPPAYQEAIALRFGVARTYLQANLWDRLGWTVKKKAEPAESATTGGGADAVTQLLAGRGGVVGLHSDADWEAALEATKAGTALFVDFTATWCGPCQRIAPDFAKLAASHPESLFVKVRTLAEPP